MPLIGNVSNTYNYYSDRELLMEILGKINNIDMALNTLLEVVEDIKDAVEVLEDNLEIEIAQIDAKFNELLARIAELDNSDAVRAVAEDLRTSVLAGINAVSEGIQNIIPDVVDPDNPDLPDDPDGE
jgi:regulator of replication initiation timing